MQALDVKQAARKLGFDLVGIVAADAETHWDFTREWIEAGRHGDMAYLANHLEAKRSVRNLLPGCESIVMVGLMYKISDPNVHIAKYAQGRDYHKVLTAKLRKLAAQLPAGEHRICTDAQPLMERELAHLAGLGWFGKNSMLIHSRLGSYFVLGGLLTTLTLEPDLPAEGGCGTCRACIDACPTGAIIHDRGRWQVDARECISTWTIEQDGLLSEDQLSRSAPYVFGCDICQDVCPFNAERESQPERARLTKEPDFLQKSAIAQRSLTEMAEITDEEWDLETRGSPVRRAGFAKFVQIAQYRARRAKG